MLVRRIKDVPFLCIFRNPCSMGCPKPFGHSSEQKEHVINRKVLHPTDYMCIMDELEEPVVHCLCYCC
jgi:hypothetical protein